MGSGSRRGLALRGAGALHARGAVVVLVSLYVLAALVVLLAVGGIFAIRRILRLRTAAPRYEPTNREASLALPVGACLYRVNGAQFLGAALAAVAAMRSSHTDTFDVLIMDVSRVASVDEGDFIALEDALGALRRRGKQVILAGPFPYPPALFERLAKDGVRLSQSLRDAIEWAQRVTAHAAASARSAR